MIKETNDRGGSGPESRGRWEPSIFQSSLQKAFYEGIADVYGAEVQLMKALPKMAQAAQAEELRQAFENHLEETEAQAERLDELVEAMGETMQKKKCQGMEGLIQEAEQMMEQYKGNPALDAILIANAQKVEHYEIASYGTLCAWAEQLGLDEALELLQTSLDEEENTDEHLTTIAETVANQEAHNR